MRTAPATLAVLLAGCGLVADLDPAPRDASFDFDAGSGRMDGSLRDAASGDAARPDGDGANDAGSRCAPLTPFPASTDTPLLLGDLIGIDPCGAPSLDVGFRCKSYTFCTTTTSCTYYDTNLGHVNSTDPLYYDGIVVEPAAPVMFHLAVGPASQCGDPDVTIAAGDFLRIQDAGGRSLDVWLPAWTGGSLTLYVGADGSTYYDAARTMPAGVHP